MWINNREWIVLTGCLVLIVPGILYFSFKPYYQEYYIKDLGNPRKISIISNKMEHKKLLIKIDGVSNVDYALRLSLFSKKNNDRAALSSYQRSYSEEIKIPAGTVSGDFVRIFSSDQRNRKAEIMYWPTNKSGKGTIKIEAGIF